RGHVPGDVEGAASSARGFSPPTCFNGATSRGTWRVGENLRKAIAAGALQRGHVPGDVEGSAPSTVAMMLRSLQRGHVPGDVEGRAALPGGVPRLDASTGPRPGGRG